VFIYFVGFTADEVQGKVEQRNDGNDQAVPAIKIMTNRVFAVGILRQLNGLYIRRPLKSTSF